jgi:hypothetical protein
MWSLDQSWGASMLWAGADAETVGTSPMRPMLMSAVGFHAAVRLHGGKAVIDNGVERR